MCFLIYGELMTENHGQENKNMASYVNRTSGTVQNKVLLMS